MLPQVLSSHSDGNGLHVSKSVFSRQKQFSEAQSLKSQLKFANVGKSEQRSIHWGHGCVKQLGIHLPDYLLLVGDHDSRVMGSHGEQWLTSAANDLKDSEGPDEQEHQECKYVQKKGEEWVMRKKLSKSRFCSSFPTHPPSLLSAQLGEWGKLMVLNGSEWF